MEKLSGRSSSFAISVATFFPDNELTIWTSIPRELAINHMFSIAQPRLRMPKKSPSEAGARRLGS